MTHYADEPPKSGCLLSKGWGPLQGSAGSGSKLVPKQPPSPDTCTIVPDLYPDACRKHDDCYRRACDSKEVCDSDFFYDMLREHPMYTVYPALLYYGGVWRWGGPYYGTP